MTKQILLADDSVTIQKVIELTFMEEDYKLTAVSNGDEALERLPSLGPDLVIADVHMPGASGFEVSRRAKDLDPGVPVILLVGTFEPFDEEEAAASGADAHLKKPFDSQELLHLVARLMDGGGAAAAIEAGPAEEPAGEDALPPLAAIDDLPELEDEDQPAAMVAGEDEPGDEVAFELREEEELGGDLAWDEQEGAAPGEPEPFDLPAGRRAAGAGEEDEVFDLGADEDDDLLLVEDEPLADLEEPEIEPFVLGEGVAASAGEEQEDTVVDRPARIEDEGETVSAEEAIDRAAEQAPSPLAVEDSGGAAASLSDQEVERIARRVAELVGERVIREVAWEVVPDLAEVVIKDRLRELEGQID